MLSSQLIIMASDNPEASSTTMEVESGGGAVGGEVLSPRALHIASDNNVVIDGLRDEYTGTYLNSATVVAGVRDAAGAPIASGVECTYEAGSDGVYHGVIDASHLTTIVDGASYDVEIAIVSGQYDDLRRVTVKGQYHGRS